MVEIQSKEILNKISEDIKESNVNLLPRELSKNIQAVLIVNPKNISNSDIVKSDSRATTGSTTLHTTSTTRDTYLVSVTLGAQADATADNTLVNLTITPSKTAVTNILRLAKLTTTVFTGNISLNLSEPLLLARNTAISFGSTFTVGAVNMTASVVLFEVDTLQK